LLRLRLIMGVRRPRILVAAPAAVSRQLERAFAGDAEIVGEDSWHQAVTRLHEVNPDLIIVCYVFDEMRPFRLLHYVRHDWKHPHVPTLLVRALPVALGKSQEEEIRESYKTLGVDDFFNLRDEVVRHGKQAALERLRDCVLSRLPRFSAAAS
jgi:PleD family two-component response regulator